jgi:PepSY-associated transmembrane protein
LRSLLVLHRWLGVALCLFFLLWFPSGIGMMYWDFPSVTAADLVERSSALNPASIRLSPADAYARAGARQPPAQVRLSTVDGRPVYRFRSGRAETVVYADNGEPSHEASVDQMLRIAAAWSRQPAAEARVEPIHDVDQWTVQAPLRTLRPLWKYSWPDGDQVYVAQTSGDVVQYTTSASRLGAYLGPIPHWLYFTPLRKNQAQWSALVIWSSGVATVTAIAGLVLGLSLRLPTRGFRRWHVVFGLIFGVAAITWAFSGLLSMDPFPAATGRPSDARQTIDAALQDRLDLAAFDAKPPGDALAEIGSPVKELELVTTLGRPAYLATARPGDTAIVPVDGRPRREFDRQQIIDRVTAAARDRGGADVFVSEAYDRYYLDRHRARPLPVIVAQLHDADRTRVYIDPRTARIVGEYNSSRWMTRWLYHGLHSLDLPWLYAHRPAWDIVMIGFMLGGTALSITSLVLAWRALGKKLRRAITPLENGSQIS